MIEKIKKHKFEILFSFCMIGILFSITLPILNEQLAFDTQVIKSLYLHEEFYGNPWYNAPMNSKTVTLKTNTKTIEGFFQYHASWGSDIYYLEQTNKTFWKTDCRVISDYWDSCEHNPDQQHFIAVDYVNKTAYEERKQLDNDIETRNFLATRALLIWVNAEQVMSVK